MSSKSLQYLDGTWLLRKRVNDYKNQPEQAIDFDTAMGDIEKDL